jgi:14-3-3 protein epsilon
VAFAKLAKQAERYDEMVGYMDVVVSLADELTVEEWGLLDVAYFEAITNRLRRMHAILSQEQMDRYETLYAGKLGDEAAKLCEKILNYFDFKFMPMAEAKEEGTEVIMNRRKQFEKLMWRCA